MKPKTAYQAWGTHGAVTRDTPQEAAKAYFEQFHRSHKCQVVQGIAGGHLFTVGHGRASYKDVTKKQAHDDSFWKRQDY